ncbi:MULTISPECIES: DUF4913 domain-containing protein [unclassified Arthrobacter]|uniref:DUF4913 domain-containing protein n=1 Tax=unclassified Arthrobacter TaxID=235627 RepID=UPI0027D7D01E|nr:MULTISPECIES: DUF4913 domain-containing protein [unclassified Arthrobacter]
MDWYFHPEAVSRVEALWRAWEHLRLDGATGISVWFKDHADHHMSVLLDLGPCLHGHGQKCSHSAAFGASRAH